MEGKNEPFPNFIRLSLQDAPLCLSNTRQTDDEMMIEFLIKGDNVFSLMIMCKMK